jgi:hypothetical protein
VRLLLLSSCHQSAIFASAFPVIRAGISQPHPPLCAPPTRPGVPISTTPLLLQDKLLCYHVPAYPDHTSVQSHLHTRWFVGLVGIETRAQQHRRTFNRETGGSTRAASSYGEQTTSRKRKRTGPEQSSQVKDRGERNSQKVCPMCLFGSTRQCAMSSLCWAASEGGSECVCTTQSFTWLMCSSE